mmetsp:Transcript_23780/g.60655  ORF Transcript_23780/g.60655 Transcript_23780/m.60655 type:complete len:274 (+) Transcript_23780:559-1380(+)
MPQCLQPVSLGSAACVRSSPRQQRFNMSQTQQHPTMPQQLGRRAKFQMKQIKLCPHCRERPPSTAALTRWCTSHVISTHTHHTMTGPHHRRALTAVLPTDTRHPLHSAHSVRDGNPSTLAKHRQLELFLYGSWALLTQAASCTPASSQHQVPLLGRWQLGAWPGAAPPTLFLIHSPSVPRTHASPAPAHLPVLLLARTTAWQLCSLLNPASHNTPLPPLADATSRGFSWRWRPWRAVRWVGPAGTRCCTGPAGSWPTPPSWAACAGRAPRSGA